MTESRKHCRLGRSCQHDTLADALYCTIHHADVGTTQIAESLGVRRGYLLDAANPDREDVQFQARLLVPLVRVTGNYCVLDLLEHQVRRVAASIPADVTPGAEGPADIFNHAAALLDEANAVIQEARRSIADQVITGDELRIVRGHVMALHSVLAAFEAFIAQQALPERPLRVAAAR
jgi:hypothetical protein